MICGWRVSAAVAIARVEAALGEFGPDPARLAARFGVDLAAVELEVGGDGRETVRRGCHRGGSRHLETGNVITGGIRIHRELVSTIRPHLPDELGA